MIPEDTIIVDTSYLEPRTRRPRPDTSNKLDSQIQEVGQYRNGELPFNDEEVFDLDPPLAENMVGMPPNTTTSRREVPGSRAPAQSQNTEIRITRSRARESHAMASLQARVFYTAYQTATSNSGDPLTYQEAIDSAEAIYWRAAIDSELASLQRNNTWKLVQSSKLSAQSRHVLAGRWVFRTKRDQNGDIIRYKARWVVKGYEQKYGIDYDQTFAGVVKSTSWKAILAIAALYDLEIEQMDVVTAFLNGECEEELYVEPPPGLELPDGYKKSEFACRLLKALYGLKQAPRLWQKKLASVLQDLGYKPILADHCIFRNKNTGIIICTYVDDFLLVGRKGTDLDQIKQDLAKRFEMKDLGPCEYFLGIRIVRDRKDRTITLVQDAYIDKILGKFNMTKCHGVATPMDPGIRALMTPFDGTASKDDIELYQSIVGSEMYLGTQTRPDITYALSILSRFLSNPLLVYIKAAL